MRMDVYSCLSVITILYSLVEKGLSIQCYQCDSNEDKSCPSYHYFDTNINALVDCNSFEAHVPGTFCMKISQQSPGCVAWGCRWTYEDNGVWKEVCYCEDRDGCNQAGAVTYSLTVMGGTLLLSWLRRLL